METLRLLVWSLCFQHITESLVNIATNKEAWYCNRNPLDLHPISALSNNDLLRINKLKQLHVMTRHGSRTHSENLQKYFPNNTQYYHCNISTITSRIEYNDEQNKNKYFVSMLKQYEYNNQYLLHSNCQRMQSYPSLIQQHQQNAQILINAYMNNNDEPSQLFDIYELNKQFQTQQNIKTYTSNKERCMLSTMTLISTLLNISASNDTLISPTITTITNDLDTNPYESPKNVLCLENEQFNRWENKYISDITDNFIAAKHDQILSQYDGVLNEYMEQGGKVINESSSNSIYNYNDPGFHVTFYYCNGFDIPLRNDTFWGMVAANYQRFVAIHPNKSSKDQNEREYATKKECYNHFLAIPMYSRYFGDIYALINNEENSKKFILHSAHDSSIKWFLNGLGLHDGIIPYFAQMFTLEIYAANLDGNNKYNSDRNITYLFRWTNKGKFVGYEYCKQEYEATNGELCDLNILLNNGFKDVNVTQRDWATNRCKTLLDDCVCGYCNENTDGKGWIFEQISFIIGLFSGLIAFALCLLVMKYAKSKLKSTQRNRTYQQALDTSDIEMEDKLENATITK